MTNSLEQRYRELLRWYPSSWRRSNGEALIGTLLDVADSEGRTEVAASEQKSLIVAGLKTRVDRVVPMRVRDAAATIALSMAAGSAVVMFVMSSWAPWGTTGRVVPNLFTSNFFGPFYDLGPVLALLWAAALGSALAGQWRVGRWLAAAAIPMAVLLPLVARSGGFLSPDCGVLTYSAVCGALAACGTPRTRLPLLGATVGSAAIVFTNYAASRYWSDVWFMFWQPTDVLWSITVYPFLLSIVALGTALLLTIGRLRTAAFALLLAAAPAIVTLIEIKSTRTYGQMLDPWPLLGFLALELALLSFLSRTRYQHSGPAPLSNA